MTRVKTESPTFLRRMAAVREYLTHNDSTIRELTNLLGLPNDTVDRAVQIMHKSEKVVHICGWKPKLTKKLAYAAVYAYGPGKDAPHPLKD